MGAVQHQYLLQERAHAQKLRMPRGIPLLTQTRFSVAKLLSRDRLKTSRLHRCLQVRKLKLLALASNPASPILDPSAIKTVHITNWAPHQWSMDINHFNLSIHQNSSQGTRRNAWPGSRAWGPAQIKTRTGQAGEDIWAWACPGPGGLTKEHLSYHAIYSFSKPMKSLLEVDGFPVAVPTTLKTKVVVCLGNNLRNLGTWEASI